MKKTSYPIFKLVFTFALLSSTIVFGRGGGKEGEYPSKKADETITSAIDKELYGKGGTFEGFNVSQEVVAKRTKFAKHFRNADGSFTVQTGDVYHYKDKGGTWKDISLAVEKSTGKPGYGYANETNEFKTWFPEKPGGKSVNMNLAGNIGFSWWNNPTLNFVVNGQVIQSFKPSDVEGINTINRENTPINKTVTYPNVYNGISEEFVMLKNGIENNTIVHLLTPQIKSLPSGALVGFKQFIPLQNGWDIDVNGVKKSKDFKTTEFHISIPGTENGIFFSPVIVFDNMVSKEDALYLVYAPTEKLDNIQKAQKKAHVLQAEYKISFVSGGIEVSTLLPSDWLKAPGRSFPVVIDPTVTITPPSPSGNYYAPTSNWYGFQRHANLYLASEIGTSNIIISDIEYNRTNTTGTNAVKPYEVYMNTTTATALTNAAWNSSTYIGANGGLTPLFNSSVDFHGTTTGWKMFTFTTPFLYTSDNLIVMVKDLYGNSGSAKYMNRTSGAAVAGRQAGKRQDTNDPGDGSTLTAEDYLAEIRITYINAAACSGVPTAGTVNVSNAAPCLGMGSNLSLSGTTAVSGLSFQWYTATSLSGPWVPEGGTQVSAPITVTPPASGNHYYYCEVSCGTSLGYSDTAILTVPSLFPAGTYTIDAGSPASATNFQSFGAATAAINCGIAGPVIFNVVANSGPYNEQINFPATIGSDAINTVTFNGNGNTLTTSTPSANSYATVNINGADYITFNDLTIEALGTDGFAVHLMNGSDNNSFRRCTINASPTATGTTSACVSMSGSETSYSTGSTNGSNNLFDSCSLSGGYFGFVFYSASAGADSMNNITNCTISDYYVYGSYNTHQRSGIVSNNIFDRATRASVGNAYGVLLTTGCVNMRVEKNIIRNMFPGTNSGTGYLLYCATDGTAGRENKFINNLVYNIGGNGTLYGMYLSGADYVQAYNNTIVLDNASATAGSTYGIYSTGTVGGIEIKNNNVYISRSGTGTKYCLYYTGNGAKSSDYNNLFITPASTNNIGYDGSAQQSFTSWQSSTGAGSPFDVSSQNLDPMLLLASSGDFSPKNPMLDNMGTPLTIVVDDINGAPRDPNTPDIGAIEFTIPACAGTPDSSMVTGPDSVCANAPFTLIATGMTIATGITYDWQYYDGSNWQSTGGTNTSYTETVGIATPTNFRMVTYCINSGLYDTSNVKSITVKQWYNCYCTPISTCVNEGIENVTFNTLNNSSNKCTNAMGYEDFGNLGSVTSVTQGAQVPISVTGWINSNPAGAGVWIDYDQNGVFDTTEFTLIGTTTSFNGTAGAYTFSNSVTIDINALTGITRMRVRSANSTPATQISKHTACLQSNAYGEYEDYLITILPANTCSGTPNQVTASSVANICPSSPFNIASTNASTGFGLTYEWQYDDGTGWQTLLDANSVPVSSFNYTVPGITVPTQYRFISSCSGGGADTSNIVSVGINGFIYCYCIPTGGGNTSYGINNFSTTGGWVNISNLNSGTTPTPGYTDYSATHVLTTSIGSVITLAASGVNSGYTYGWAVWVDWNKNGSFADPGELMYNTTGYTNAIPANTTFTVPSTDGNNNTVDTGYRKMRVIANYNNSNPSSEYCVATSGTAEWEDYMVNITNPPTCFPPTSLNATNATVTTVDLNWTSIGAQSQIEYGIGNFALGTGTRTAIFTNTGIYSLNSLTYDTVFSFFVRDWCSATDSSVWSTRKYFYLVPPNDDCANAIDITNQQSYTGTTGGAIQSITPCNGQTLTANDVWYSFTPASAGSVTVTAFSPVADLVMEVMSGACGGSLTTLTATATNSSPIASGSNTCIDGPAAGTESATYSVTANTTYYVHIFGYNASEGTFTINATGAPLAIKLDKLSAANVGASNRVEWNTLSEERTDKFELQRSADGMQFVTIYEKDANGEPSRYTYMDNSPVKGYNYYRLRMTEANGNATYSEVVKTFVKSAGFEVNAYPNPVSHDLTVKVSGVQGTDAAIQITDVTGKMISTIKMAGNVEKINMSGLANGIYLIKYSDTNHTQTIKVNKQ